MYISVTSVGRISKEINLKYIKNSGKALCEFDVAIERKVNQNESETDFYPVQIWGNYGETLSKILDKGQLILISGSCKNTRWKDENNNTHKDFKIIADFIKIIDFNNKSSYLDVENLESNLVQSAYEDKTF